MVSFRASGRYYDPTTARFISEDPASDQYYNPPLGRWTHSSRAPSPGDPVSYNRYAYAGNDPVDLRDPSGDDPLEDAEEDFKTAYEGMKSAWDGLACAVNAGLDGGGGSKDLLQTELDCLSQYIDSKVLSREKLALWLMGDGAGDSTEEVGRVLALNFLVQAYLALRYVAKITKEAGGEAFLD